MTDMLCHADEPAEAFASERATRHAWSFSTRGMMEHIPKWLDLIPMIIQWLWLGLKYGSIGLPSSANPRITSGGMVGEGKLEYFDIMGPLARSMTAASIAVTADGMFSLDETCLMMQAAGLCFPIVAKPNIGWCGYGVRLVSSPAELGHYAARYPSGETFLLQRYIPDEGEAGIFYMRDPDEARGSIIGMLLRHYPRVVGDGRRTIAEIIAADPRLSRMLRDGLHQPSFEPDRVPLPGESVRLALIGSARAGGLYLDGTEHATEQLISTVDAVARDMADFHVGRFDVRYRSLEDLKCGDFTIMEVNGSGSEVVHAWDPKYTVPQVYGMVFAKQRRLFALADKQRRRGHRPIALGALARLHLRQQRLMSAYPRSN